MDNLEAAGRERRGARGCRKTAVYVASGDQVDLRAAWPVVRARFAEHDVPSTLLGVAALGYDDQLVEVEAVAAIRL